MNGQSHFDRYSNCNSKHWHSIIAMVVEIRYRTVVQRYFVTVAKLQNMKPKTIQLCCKNTFQNGPETLFRNVTKLPIRNVITPQASSNTFRKCVAGRLCNVIP